MPRRVLVVDDDPDNADILAVLLRRDGHDVRIERDGERAIACAGEYRPEVVILDVGLPTLDGLSVARALRRDVRWQPVLIALTGRAQPEDIEAARAAGFDDYFVKPIADTDAFRERIRVARRA